ncbi:hypothetical protein JCM10450v2_006101 [Rhodotorula kratochvilovae]
MSAAPAADQAALLDALHRAAWLSDYETRREGDRALAAWAAAHPAEDEDGDVEWRRVDKDESAGRAEERGTLEGGVRLTCECGGCA